MMPKLDVLIVEDRAADAELMTIHLRNMGYEVKAERVETLPDVLAALDKEPDIVLVDHTLPGLTAEAVLEEVRNRGTHIPTIVVSGTINEEKGIELMKLGASDYILKDRRARLGPAVKQALDGSRELRERQALADELRMAQRVGRMGSWRMDVDSRAVSWSPQMYELFMRKPWQGPIAFEEFLGLVKEQDALAVEGVLARALKGTPVPPVQLEIKLPHGEFHWFEGRIEPVRGKNQEVVALRGTWQDITTEKRTEIERWAVEGRLAQLVENLPEGILRLSPEGWIEHANPAAVSILGFGSVSRLKALVGNFATMCVNANDFQIGIQAIQQGTTKSFDLQLRRPDQTHVWAAFTGSTETLPDGSTCIVASLRDLTTQRLESETSEHLAAVVQASSDAIISLDFDGILKSWNRAAERIFGYRAHEAVAHHVFQKIVPSDRQDEWLALMAQIMAGESPARFETNWVRKNGVRVEISVAMNALRDASGQVTGAAVICQDLTARKKAEKTRLDLDRQQQEVKRLKEISDMRMQFINVAAHDLNTPLTPVRLLLATLRQDKGLAESHRQTLQLLERNVERFRVLVQDMLDSARLEGGGLKLNLKAVDLAAAATEAVGAFEEQALQGGVKVQIAGLPTTPVTADREKLSQVLYNLVSNAIKYSPAGGNVEIAGAVHDRYAEFEIRDEGLGLTPEQISQLFAPFARLHEGMPNVPKGTGLGLYISKGIIEQHGGRMFVRSDGPGKGSTFGFSLPIWNIAMDATKEQVASTQS